MTEPSFIKAAYVTLAYIIHPSAVLAEGTWGQKRQHRHTKPSKYNKLKQTRE